MTRHNIVGSEAGRSLAPGHGSLSSIGSRRRSSYALPVSLTLLAGAAIASAAVLLLRH